MTTERPDRLSAAEIAFYKRNGYVVPRYRLPEDDLARLRALVFKVVRDNPQLDNMPIAMPHVPSDGRNGQVSDGGLMAFARHPVLLDMIAQLAGPDLILWQTTIFHKPAKVGTPTPWHQDGAYWPIQPPANTSFWIAVSDSKADNGCFRCIPGAVTGLGPLPHDTGRDGGTPFGLHIAPAAYDEKDAVDIELEPGELLFFDIWLLHGARPNRGTRPRTGFAARYMPATSFFDHDAGADKALPPNPDMPGALQSLYARVPLYVVRGENRNPRNDLKRNHPAPAAAR